MFLAFDSGTYCVNDPIHRLKVSVLSDLNFMYPRPFDVLNLIVVLCFCFSF